MDISSTFNAGLQGFQRATQDANQAASEIASADLFNQSASDIAREGQTTSPINVNQQQPTNLTESIVDLRVAEVQARASAEVIQTADEVLGTLLDVRV